MKGVGNAGKRTTGSAGVGVALRSGCVPGPSPRMSWGFADNRQISQQSNGFAAISIHQTAIDFDWSYQAGLSFRKPGNSL